MPRSVAPAEKRTIVRLLPTLAAALVTSGCVGLPPRTAPMADCPPPGARICESFGPERRCRCTNVRAFERELARVALSGRSVTGW